MALVDNREKVPREIVNQRKRRLARLLFGQKARVVLNAGAKTGFPEHLDIVVCPLFNALRLEELILAL